MEEVPTPLPPTWTTPVPQLSLTLCSQLGVGGWCRSLQPHSKIALYKANSPPLVLLTMVCSLSSSFWLTLNVSVVSVA